MTNQKTVHVISWRYSDNSAFGIVGVYDSMDRVEQVLRLLSEHGDSMKEFKLRDVVVE